MPNGGESQHYGSYSARRCAGRCAFCSRCEDNTVAEPCSADSQDDEIDLQPESSNLPQRSDSRMLSMSSSVGQDDLIRMGEPLTSASWRSELDIVRQLLDLGADVNSLEEGAWGGMMTSLHIAACQDNRDLVELLLNAGADLNARNFNDDTPLNVLVAMYENCTDLASYMLQRGANPAWSSSKCGNALHMAAAYGRTGFAELLLSTYPELLDSTRRSELEETPLHIACIRGHIDVVKILVEHGACLRSSVNPRGQHCLHLAAYHNSIDCVRYILAAGADVAARDCDGWTPLLCAADKGHWHVAVMLLEHGADANEQLKDGLSALMLASSNGHVDFVRHLLAVYEPDVELADLLEGSRSLHWASTADANREELMQCLLESGAEIDAPNKKNATPFIFTAEHNNLESMQFLFSRGASIMAPGKQQPAALIQAVRHRNIPMAKVLLRWEADPDAKMRDGRTPLLMAIRNDDLGMARLLLSEGTDPNSRDLNDKNWTPLHHASHGGQHDMLQLLLDFGALPGSEDKNGMVASDVAEGEIASVLRSLLSQSDHVKLEGLPINILGKAIAGGHLDQVRRLMDRYDIEINACNSNGRRLVSIAAQEGDQAMFDLLLTKGACPRLRDRHGETALWWASRSGHADIVRQILSHGGDLVDVGDCDNRTPLMMASQKGHIENVRVLVAHGAEVNSMTLQGFSALGYANQGHSPETVSLLKDAGAILDLSDGDDRSKELSLVLSDRDTNREVGQFSKEEEAGRSLSEHGLVTVGNRKGRDSSIYPSSIDDKAGDGHETGSGDSRSQSVHGVLETVDHGKWCNEELLWAVRQKRIAAIHRLIKGGAPADGLTQADPKKSPLMEAVIGGNKNAVVALLQNGANAGLQVNGSTAMHLAAGANYVSLIHILHQAGCPYESRGLLETPLCRAAASGCLDAARALIQLGAHLESRNGEFENSPLLEAVKYGHISMVELLLEQGADRQSVDKRGCNALHYAVSADSPSITRFLLENGVEVKLDIWQESPLHVAARIGSASVVQTLLDHGHNIDSLTEGTKTCLMLATIHDYSTIAVMLIEAGADIDLQDSDVRTALTYAKDLGNDAIMNILYLATTLRASNEREILKLEQTGLSHRTRFQYSSLPSPHHIRVLYLSPGEPGSVISFELGDIDLSESQVEYDALSYEWGDGQGTVPVKCNDSRMLVTPNCKAALTRLRHETHMRVLWVDALCINQEDILERNSQVTMMGEIFTRARSVMMWLGEEDSTTQAAFYHIPRLAAIYEQLTIEDAYFFHAYSDAITDALQERPDLMKEVVEFCRDDDCNEALVKLANRSYFTRLWIAHEVILAGARGNVISGSYNCSWNELSYATNLISSIQRSRLPIHFEGILDMSRHFSRSRGILLDTIYEMSKLNATDLRDKIFVPLGLTKTETNARLVKMPLVDYQLTLAEVIVQTARFFIHCHGYSGMTSLFRTRRNQRTVRNVPSWVPELIHAGVHVQPSRTYKVDLSRCLPHQNAVTTSVSLFTRGLVLDKIIFKTTLNFEYDLYSSVLGPLFRVLGGAYATYNVDVKRERKRSCMQAVMDLMEIDLTQVQLGKEYIAWRLLNDEDYGVRGELSDHYEVAQHSSAAAKDLCESARRWEATRDGGPDPGHLELKVQGELEDNVKSEIDIVVTEKGVVGITDEGDAELGQVVIFLPGQVVFNLCETKEKAPEPAHHDTVKGETRQGGNGRYYEMVGFLHTDHLKSDENEEDENQEDENEETVPTLEELWPGQNDIEDLEFR